MQRRWPKLESLILHRSADGPPRHRFLLALPRAWPLLHTVELSIARNDDRGPAVVRHLLSGLRRLRRLDVSAVSAVHQRGSWPAGAGRYERTLIDAPCLEMLRSPCDCGPFRAPKLRSLTLSEGTLWPSFFTDCPQLTHLRLEDAAQYSSAVKGEALPARDLPPLPSLVSLRLERPVPVPQLLALLSSARNLREALFQAQPLVLSELALVGAPWLKELWLLLPQGHEVKLMRSLLEERTLLPCLRTLV